MTRSNLLRFAQVSAAALGACILAAALAQSTRAGLASTARLLTVLGLSGVVTSLGWHGTAATLEHREERKRAERRHRVPRPDRGAPRRPDTTEPSTAAGADAYPNPYLGHDSGHRMATAALGGPMTGPGRVDEFEDLYAHRSASPA